ncbi:MAG TPA: tetratricopeptide repeat protein [bacterium]|nr:tetratricopeptide repeat protein [bacterium]
MIRLLAWTLAVVMGITLVEPCRSVYPLEEAHTRFLEGRYSEAVQLYSKIMTDSVFQEHRPEAMFLSAISYLNMGNSDMALRALWQLVGDYPSSQWADNAYLELARIKELEGRVKLPESLMLYETIPSRYPDSEQLATAWLGAARVKMKLGYFSEAGEALKRALENGSLDTAENYLDIARFYAHPKNPVRQVDKAIEYLNIIVTRYPDFQLIPDVYMHLGKLYWEAGERSKALIMFREVVIRDPVSPASEFAQESIARIYRETGDHGKAISAYQVLLSRYALSSLTRDAIRKEIDALGDTRSDRPTVSAWKASMDPSGSRASYSGDVMIRYYQLTIQADDATVDFRKNTITATHHVRVKWSDRQVIHCESIQCDVASQTAILEGEVTVTIRSTDGFDRRTGDRFQMSLADGSLISGTGKEGKKE